MLPVHGHALTPTQVFDKVKNAVVVVKTLDVQDKVKAQGSGVILSSGRVATNCHVVEDGVSYRVGRGDQLVSATLYAEDADKDICILNAKGLAGKPAQLGKATDLKVGDPVYAVGAPQGLELSLSDGIVAQLRGGPPPFIQTTAAISPGSSGGGLFDKEGRLVGLTTLYIEGGQNLNFAMPVEWIGEVKPGRKPVAKGIGLTEWEKRAIALETTKDWQGLLEWCRNWTKSEPENAMAWFGLGIAYARLSRYDDAIEAFRQALSIDPKDTTAAWYLGYAYDNLNRYEEAVEAYRHALRVNPKYAKAWSGLGGTYEKLSRYKDAIDAYRQSLSIDPKNGNVWHGLGYSYDNLSRFTDAIEAYHQALRIDPKNGNIWYNLGIDYVELKRYKDAIDAYRQSLRIDPKNGNVWNNLGIAYGKIKHYEDAINTYRQSLRINPDDATARYNLGYSYFLSGNRIAALDTVQELRRLDPEKADRLFNVIVPR
jgi:tetratricopeptide (TPR) repeat protein